MKKTICLLLTLLPLCLPAQVECFQLLYQEGKTACERREFNTALKRLVNARDCPDKPPFSELEDWIRRAEQGRAERNLWRRALNADNRETYQTYLALYPNGFYQSKATENLRRLEALADRPLVQNTLAGAINWTQEYIEARGQSIINREKWPNEAQAILMAQRGAEVVAKANLLETVNGIRITRTTTVKDMGAESDLIRTQVEGVVIGAQPIGQPLVANGMVTVTLRMPIFGSSGVITPPKPAPDTSDVDLKSEPPLALRLAAASSQPVLFPSFVDEHNNLLLDGANLGPRHSGPLVRYCRTTDFSAETQRFDAAWDEQGRIVLPDSAVPAFQQWLKTRESGGGASPILVATP